MASDSVRTVFVWMLREEWRLHARLFGGRRFAAFPALVLVLAAGAVHVLRATGTAPTDAVAGLHALVFAFGLYTGSVGLVGRDALRGLLDDVSLLVFAGRTLPLSRRRLLGVFLLKDVAYYAGVFLAPLTLAFAPAVVDGAMAPTALPRLFVALVVTFVLGLGATLLALAAAARGLPGRVALIAAAAGVGALHATGYDPVSVAPYALYAAPVTPRAAASLALAAVVVAAGGFLFDPAAERPARTVPDRFGAWRDRLRDPDGLLAKTLLDLARSSGGVWKVGFSGGVLFGVSAFLVETAEAITGVEPSVGVAFGAMLGLSAFTTYNWLTQVDSADAYATLPVDAAAVFRAKFRAFCALGLPTALGFVALAAVLFGARPFELAAGALLAAGIAVYLFGLTVYLAGLDPNEFLFDVALFAAFTLAVAAVLVPVLVVGLVVVPVPASLLAALGVAAVVAGGVGVALYRRAIPRWRRRYRTA